MKKLLSVLLILTMIFAFASCSKLFGGDNPGDNPPDEPSDNMSDVPESEGVETPLIPVDGSNWD